MSGHRARKRFGQHFLSDPGVIDAIVRAVNVNEDDVVVEIGPGLGAITQSLAQRAGHLHAVELDRDLVAQLETQYANNERVSIVEADALRFDFSSLGPRIRVVGNLPYNISTPLLFHLLDFREQIVDMHFMLQKEVVDRMAASPGSKAYGRLSIMLGCRLSVDSLFDVDRTAFRPPPKVTSSIVRLDPLPANTFVINDDSLFSKIVSTAFMKRRKTLRNSLKELVSNDDLDLVGIDASHRPEQLSIAQFVALSNHMTDALR